MVERGSAFAWLRRDRLLKRKVGRLSVSELSARFGNWASKLVRGFDPFGNKVGIRRDEGRRIRPTSFHSVETMTVAR